MLSGGTGYYNGANNTRIMSLRGIAAPSKNLYVEAEYGLCSSNNGPGLKVSLDKAYRIRADGMLGSKVNYSLEKIYAGPRYYGYYNDNDYFYGILNFPLSKQLGSYLSYRTYQNNLSLDREPRRRLNGEILHSGPLCTPFFRGCPSLLKVRSTTEKP